MATGTWRPSDYERLIVLGTASLCLFILVGGIVLGVLLGKITPDLLGSAKGAMAGTGLASFAVVIGSVLLRGLGK